MTIISKEALAAMQRVFDWNEGRGNLAEVAEALSRLPSVSTYGGVNDRAVSELRSGGAPGFRVELAEERDRDGGVRVKVVKTEAGQ